MRRFDPRLREGGDYPRQVCGRGATVSIHASAREATAQGLRTLTNEIVSIHASAREATTLDYLIDLFTPVSIHASAREATSAASISRMPSSVSIHASAREATGASWEPEPSAWCFDPRLREGGDFFRQSRRWDRGRFDPRLREGGDQTIELSSPTLEVSIHASAREATSTGAFIANISKVSIHASAREATKRIVQHNRGIIVSIHASAREATSRSAISSPPAQFRSTPPRGRRLDLVHDVALTNDVSIHASAREATLVRPSDRQAGAFRSTPPRGRRPALFDEWTNLVKFRSTPPRGRRPILCAMDDAFVSVSIHASAREATGAGDLAQSRIHVSIHASAREATSKATSFRWFETCFDPRLREGGD